MFLFNLVNQLKSPKLSFNFYMWQTFYIKANEIGALSRRGNFQQFLRPGKYTYFGRDWQVKAFDLNEPEAQIDNLELLLSERRAELEEYLTIIKTDFDRVALVRVGQQWMSVAPGRSMAFWRGFIPVEVHIFNLQDSLELPAEFARQIRGTISG